MSRITYTIVEHDGGWAYKLGDVYSETFRSHDAAYNAARDAAVEQQVETVEIKSAPGHGRSTLHEGTANGRE
jgi:hypothetical protein